MRYTNTFALILQNLLDSPLSYLVLHKAQGEYTDVLASAYGIRGKAGKCWQLRERDETCT